LVTGSHNTFVDCEAHGFDVGFDVRGGSNNLANCKSSRRSTTELIAEVRQALALPNELQDGEILQSLRAVLNEHDHAVRQRVARTSSVGRWLLEHASDVNTAINTLVTIAAAASQFLK
jgi:hypothetical protein